MGAANDIAYHIRLRGGKFSPTSSKFFINFNVFPAQVGERGELS